MDKARGIHEFGSSLHLNFDHLLYGIELEELTWARQRSRRMTTVWVLAVLILTGLVAAAAWTVGTNLDGLIR